MARQILFIQGGGAGVHDEWDDKLVASLKRELGPDAKVRYPRMPNEDDPKYATWKPAILSEIAKLDDVAGSVLALPPAVLRPILIGHSLGGTMLIHALAELCSCEGRSPDSSSRTGPLPSGSPQSSTLRGAPSQGNKKPRIGANHRSNMPPACRLAAIFLISAPFIGEGGWPSDDIEAKPDLGARLPPGVPVHLFHGQKDETAPPAHADLYAKAIPQAQVHRLADRDHQLNNDLSEVAEVVRGI
jgi:pimeloyl-ACP methyl ester carboxylesterase